MNLKATFAIISLFCMLSFQNCAGGSSGEMNSIAKVQQMFPEIQSIQPASSVSVSSTAVSCSGNCAVTFDNGASISGSILCGGNLTIVNDTMTCDNNLTLSR